MKKFLKIMACAVAFLTLVGIMSSCNDTIDIKVVYTASLGDNNLSSQDVANVNNYLVNHKIVTFDETKSYDVSSKGKVSDCYWEADNQSKADFEKIVTSLDEEMKTVIPAGSYFTYIWSRPEIGGGLVVVGEHGFRGE